jgi:hypothetical protein
MEGKMADTLYKRLGGYDAIAAVFGSTAKCQIASHEPNPYTAIGVRFGLWVR